ncbi:apolipophorins-like [Choristoneura fumiferana]|uniref:apolipophorins-like n=1 Tax=Choristoneura fumiferana TaxID=7141 RepID=UPI003D15810B
MLSVVVLCLCLAVAVTGLGNSLKDPYICGPPSCAESDKFRYLPETIYYYEYKVNVETYFAGSSNNRSTLDIKAEAAIQFIKPCEGLLQLRDVTLLDQDENYPVERAEKFIHAISLFELRFAFHDGIISEICPESAEEDWVLNFKRAILSLFQNSMKRFDINFKGVEQDIHGSCSVEYVVRGQEDTSLILVKTRDLSQCRNRYKYLSILQTVRYDFQSRFQTWPVLKSESKCRISVDHNIYKQVNCRERHLFEPFSGRNSGAMTTVIQDLVLVREENKTDTQIMEAQPKGWLTIEKRSNLLHHHNTHVKTETGELRSARDVLKLLCNIKESADDYVPGATVDSNLDSGSTVGLWGKLVRACRGLHYPALEQLLARAPTICHRASCWQGLPPSATEPREYYKLVRACRGLPYPALEQLLARAPTICHRASKHMLDALPYIASAGSVELIKDMILKGAVDVNTRHEWLMSMAMIPRPKKEMLTSMLELLKKQQNDQLVSFTVSSMVHSYCKHSGKSLRECCEEDTPKQIMEEFQSIVQELSTKNLATAPRAERSNIVIAIKALGNIGGFKQEFADILMNIIGDSLVPVPIRLTAVDAFRRTPCVETREYFLETFREDYVNIEVRLASYLQVMKCPTLSIIRKIYHSVRHEQVNQVATFVWSHLNNLGQSSLPSRVEIQGLLSGNPMPQLEDSPDFRMFSRNYEQSVFFDQYNAGGNYEANVIFTPDSYIPRSVSLNLTVDMFGESINILELKGRAEGFERYFENLFGKNGPLSKTKINDKLEALRFIRSLSDADQVKEKVDDIGYKNEALKHQYPMAELGIKVFGNEISYWNAEGHSEILKSLERMNPQMRILEILSGKEISYNKASLFLDTTFSVPTGCGLPLNMNLMGTSYVNTKMSGTMVDKFSQSGNLDFEGKIHPSVAVNIAATMSVTAGGLSTSGTRLNLRLYTATAVEAKLNIRGLGLVRLDLSLPSEKREIFAAKSELIILHGDEELQQQGLNQNRIEQNTCSWSTFDKGIGIKVCASYQFPNMTNLKNAPYFIMSGPAKYILSLEKADPSANTYSFQYKYDKNETNSLLSFTFNTPDSKEKRMFDAVLNLSNTSSTASLSFQSAENTLQAKGVIRNTEDDKSLEASLDIDGIKHFDTVMSLKKQDIKFGYVWLPHAYWVVNDERIAELSGIFKVKSKGGVTQADITADFQTKQLASHMVGYYTINGPTHGLQLNLDYQFYKNPKQTIKLEGVYSERPLGYRHDLYGELAMEFTAYPVYNFYSVLRNVKTQSHLDVSFNVSASREQNQNPSLTFGFTRIEKIVGMKLATHLTISKPRPVRMEFQFEEIGPKYSVVALLNVNPKSKDILVSGALYYPPGTQLFVDAQLNMSLPTLHDCTIKAKVHEKMPNEFQVNAAGIWFTGVDFNVDALYQDQSKTNMMSHRLKVILNSNHFKDIALDARFTQDNRQLTFIGQFPNMTNLKNAPYFIMSGPAKYILSLEKADPSANTYSFQYKYDKNETNSLLSFTFNTPDSKEKRMFDAVLNLSNTSSTASLSFQSAENTLQAKGVIRNTEDDKSLEASLDIDGIKHFDTVMSLKKQDIKFGYVWLPHAYWVVNDERIAELSGIFKVKSKGGVTQADITADFQTKQLASHMVGYYTINGPTHGLQLNLDYQFYKNPKQTIKLEGVYSERPLGYRHDLYGELAMEFTAYPVYNFYSVLRNVKTQSHLDVSFNVSASREQNQNPSLTFGFTRIEKIVGMKLATHLTISKPRPVRMEFQFEEIGPKYSVVALLNVNPKSKDILVSGALYYPPGTQLFVDAQLNMSLPTLHDCTIKAKVHEKMPNEFQVNAAGIWFTGVDFNVDALYQDQSKTNMMSHRLKVILNSNHFKDIALDARFTQDNRQLTFIGQGEYNEDKYRMLLRYVLLSEQNFTTYVELDANDKAYSVTLNADLTNNTNLNMDIHFDQ